MNYKKFFIIILLVLSGTVFYVSSAYSDLSGGNYEIYSDSFSVISTQQSKNGSFTLYETAGEYFSTTTSNGDYELRGGFQAQEKGILSVDLSSSSIDLGTLSTSTVSTSSVDISVSTDSETGYSVSLSEDGDFSNGSDIISDVSDGVVTAGSEEYGISTTGNDALISSDTAVSGTVNIASFSGTVTNRTTQVIFKAAISNNTASGTYSHNVTFDTTVNP